MPYNPYQSFDYGNLFSPSSTYRKNRFNYLPEYQPEDGPDTSDTSAPEPSFEGRDTMSYLDDIKDLYMKEGPAASAYRRHMQQMPVDQPSIGHRIGAAVATGLSAYGGNPRAMEIGDEALHGPYRTAMQNWLAQGQGLKEQANIEEKDRASRLGYARTLETIERDKSMQANRDRTANRLEKRDDFMQAYRNSSEFRRKAESDWRIAHGQEKFNADQAWREYQKTNNTTRNNIAEEGLGIRRGMLGVAQQNANTNSRRADIIDWTSSDRSNLNWSKLTNQGATAEDTYAPGTAMNQRRASDDAVKAVIMKDPRRFSKFVDENGQVRPEIKTGMMSTAPAKDDPDFQEFMAQVELEKKKRLTKPGRRPKSAAPAKKPLRDPAGLFES